MADETGFERTKESVPVEPAATVMVLREGPRAPEAFMLERHLQSDFAGGALVFPGGKVDEGDRELRPELWEGREATAAAADLGTRDAEEALGYLVAAVRETFEEAGVLLGRRHGDPVTADVLRSAPFTTAREALIDQDTSFDFAAWLASQGVVLDLGALAFWSWWVTPDGSHRRYDTRFFVALLPPGQAGVLAHDQVETTSSRWVTAAEALAAHDRGEVSVVYPTRKNLEVLVEFDSAAAAWEAAAAGRTDRRRIQPEIVVEDGQVLIQHPYGGPLEEP